MGMIWIFLVYKNLDATSSRNGHAEIREAVNAIRLLTHKMNEAYGILGSLFRSGSRTTFFATQVERYADVYAVSPFNLLYYPSYYFFRAPLISLPHEGTVDHLAKVGKNQSLSVDTRGVQTPLIHEDEPNFEENDDIARSKSVTPDLEEKFRFK
jgi:5'-nucleotidase